MILMIQNVYGKQIRIFGTHYQNHILLLNQTIVSQTPDKAAGHLQLLGKRHLRVKSQTESSTEVIQQFLIMNS